MSAAVAATCAKALVICDEGRYRTLMPEFDGFSFQIAVRLLFQVCESERVSIRRSRGEMTSELQLSCPCRWPADGAIQSSSIAVGLDMVASRPTMAWKLHSALRSQLRRASICRGEILCACKWICTVERGASLVDPRLGLGWSKQCIAGIPIIEIMPLTAKRNCDGMSTLMTGPEAKLKNFGCHVV